MATTTDLNGPVIYLDVPGRNYYLTYIIEDKNETTGATSIKYSLFEVEFDVEQNSYLGSWLNFMVGYERMVPRQASDYIVSYWYTNPETENTFRTTTQFGSYYQDSMQRVTVIDTNGSVCNVRKWVLEDVVVVTKNPDYYTLTLSFTNELNTFEYNVSETIGLTDIGVLTSVPKETYPQAGGATVNYIAGEATQLLQLGIFDAATDTAIVPYGNIPIVQTGKYYLQFTQDEVNVMYTHWLATTTSCKIVYKLKSIVNGATHISTLDSTLAVEGAAPELSPTITDINETTVALTGDNTKFVRYHSTAGFAVNATLFPGATIKSYKTIHNGATYSGATGSVYNVEVGKFEFSVTDSRNLSSGMVLNISFIEYIKLTCNVSAEHPTSDDTIPLTVTGNFWHNNFGVADNTLTIQYRYKSNTIPDYIEWTTAEVTPTFDGNTYVAEFEMPVPNRVDNFTIQARAIDKLSTIASKEITLQAFPIFDWDEDDFNFNVPVTMQEDLRVAGVIYQNGNPIVDYVVDQGTSGIWTFRKWASGIAECWGTVAPAAHNITSAWGSIYTKDNAIARQLYPFTFTEDPVVSMTLHNPTGNCWYFTGTPGGVNMTPAFGLARGASGSVTVGARISAIGRWK